MSEIHGMAPQSSSSVSQEGIPRKSLENSELTNLAAEKIPESADQITRRLSEKELQAPSLAGRAKPPTKPPTRIEEVQRRSFEGFNSDPFQNAFGIKGKPRRHSI